MAKPVIVSMTSILGDELYDGLKAMGEFYFWEKLSEAEKAELAPRVEVLSIYPPIGITAKELNGFPNLRYIASWGVGFDKSDIAEIKRRGILFTNTPNANFQDVADLAIGLMVSVARQIPQSHQRIQATSALPMTKGARVCGKRIGIAGMGKIGQEIALRATGFRMEIGYLDRMPKDDLPYRYFDTLNEMAKWCDFLVMALPATPQTSHIVNAQVLSDLGAQGVLINIGRGALVDTNALIDALEKKTIAGAGLDVFENEPNVDERFSKLQNVTLSPHNGGSTVEAFSDAARELLANVQAYIETGKPLTGRIV